jgi:hypothetical protein
MKWFTLGFAALVLAGCSSLGHEVASGINNSQLGNTLGKPYNQVMYERPDFGKLVGRESLPNGDVVMKHVGEFGSSTSNFAGVYGKQHQQARVIYFRVDRKGVVRHRVLQGRLVHLLGGHLQRGDEGAGPDRGVRQDRQDLGRAVARRLALAPVAVFNP